MARNVSMTYDISEGTSAFLSRNWYAQRELDNILKIGERLEKAREAIIRTYLANKVNCQIYLFDPEEGFFVKLGKDFYDSNLESALNEFVSVAGLPSFVCPWSDYELAEYVFNKHIWDARVKLERGFFNPFNGKKVVLCRESLK